MGSMVSAELGHTSAAVFVNTYILGLLYVILAGISDALARPLSRL